MWSRVVVDADDTPLAELGMVGRSEQPEAVVGHLPQHTHPTYELVYLVSGKVTWWVGTETHELAAGDLYVTRPHEVHGAVDSTLEPCDILWMQVDLDQPRPFGMSDTEVAVARSTLDGPSRTTRVDPTIARHMENVVTESLRGGDRRSVCRANCVLVLDLASRSFAATQHGEQRSPMVESAIIWFDANLDRRIPISECARAIGVPPSRLYDEFRTETGLSPNAWITRRKIDIARRRLEAGDGITTIAFALGFSSTQYFATVFKRFTGVQPRQYRAHATSLRER